MEMMEMAVALMEMEEENKVFSKVRGNRNWAIRTERFVNKEGKECKFAYVGRFGALNRANLMSALIVTIAKYNIRWYEFTYKKDFMEALQKLERDGFNIWWYN